MNSVVPLKMKTSMNDSKNPQVTLPESDEVIPNLVEIEEISYTKIP